MCNARRMERPRVTVQPSNTQTHQSTCSSKTTSARRPIDRMRQIPPFRAPLYSSCQSEGQAWLKIYACQSMSEPLTPPKTPLLALPQTERPVHKRSFREESLRRNRRLETLSRTSKRIPRLLTSRIGPHERVHEKGACP